MAEYKVLVTARSFGAADDQAYEYLQKAGCECLKLEEKDGSIEEQLYREIQNADALIAGLEQIDEKLINKAKKLKVISRYGVGYDNVDCEAAKRNGIQVTVTPGANGESVADLAIALMLAAARNVSLMDAAMKRKEQKRPQGIELFQKTLGIVGAGKIGKGVARRCRGFDMKILAYDMCPDENFVKETGACYVDLETLIRESDFISIHSPLTEKTRRMFSNEQFKMMKQDAVIVNTARGGIIDEQALYEALTGGRIRGAGLDATEQEPPYDSPLLRCENCIITPHAGAATREACSRMSLMAAENVREVLSGKKCSYNVLG